MDIVDESGIGYGTATPTQIANMQKSNSEANQYIQSKQNVTPATNTIKNQNQAIEDQITKERDENWAREDAIRKETQGREDTAYQRAVEDMRKAGVNPNLQNISGAPAGGGIAGATEKNLDRIENAKDRTLKQLIQEIELNWKGNQNDLDRTTKLISSLMGMY